MAYRLGAMTEKRTKQISVASVLVALGTAAGGVALDQSRSGHFEEKVLELQMAVARLAAQHDVYNDRAKRDLEDLADALELLERAVDDLEDTTMLLSRGRRDRSQIVERAEAAGELLQKSHDKVQKIRDSRPDLPDADEEDVRALQVELFEG